MANDDHHEQDEEDINDGGAGREGEDDGRDDWYLEELNWAG